VGVLADTDTKLQGLGISLKPEAIATRYGDDYLIPERDDSPQLSGEQTTALINIVSSAKAGGWSPELVTGLINSALPVLTETAVAAITSNLGDAEQDGAEIQQEPSISLDQVAAQFAAPAKKKNCVKGISCGNSCIASNKVCKKPLTETQKEIRAEIVNDEGTRLEAAKPKPIEEQKSRLPKDEIDIPPSKAEPVYPPLNASVFRVPQKIKAKVAGQDLLITTTEKAIKFGSKVLSTRDIDFKINKSFDASIGDKREAVKVALGTRRELLKLLDKFPDGAIITNNPYEGDGKGEGRAKLYSSYGFGDKDNSGTQWGMVKGGKILPLSRRQVTDLIYSQA
jgi:hypothetical protein